jgi:hypothetical protein
MTIGEVVVEVDSLAGIFFLEPLVYMWSVFDWNAETGPSDPSEVHCFLETRQGRYQTTRGHFEVVFALVILVNGDGETVGDYNKMAVLA